MANRYNVYSELLGGALLATIVGVAPRYLMGLRLGLAACRPDCLLSYTCPGVWIYLVLSVLASVALICSRCLRLHVVVQLTWLVVSVHYCLNEINKEDCMLRYIRKSGDARGPLLGAFTLAGLFFSALYQGLKFLYDL